MIRLLLLFLFFSTAYSCDVADMDDIMSGYGLHETHPKALTPTECKEYATTNDIPHFGDATYSSYPETDLGYTSNFDRPRGCYFDGVRISYNTARVDDDFEKENSQNSCAKYIFNVGMTYCIQCTTTGVIGCTIPGAENYDATATLPWDETCTNFTMGTTNLFFASMGETQSEASNWITIYNPTNVDVSLNRYFIRNPQAGGDGFARSYQFVSDAIVPANGLYKICGGNHAETSGRHVAGSCDAYYEPALRIYGDDTIQLSYGLPDYDYIIIDTIGDENGDPGSGWDVCGVATATKNHIIVRKAGRIVGDPDWTASAGTNADNCEWSVFGPHTSYTDPSGYMHSKVYPLVFDCPCTGGIGATDCAVEDNNGVDKCVSCTGEFYLNGDQCDAWATCSAGEGETQAPDTTQNRICSTCVDQYSNVNTSFVCTDYTPTCGDGFQQIQAPSTTQDRICKCVVVCPNGRTVRCIKDEYVNVHVSQCLSTCSDGRTERCIKNEYVNE